MVERGKTPVDQAWKEIPRRWYERSMETYAYLNCFVTLSGIIIYERLTEHTPVLFRIVGGTVYLLSIIADRKTTAQELDMREKAVKQGSLKDVARREQNIVLGHVRTGEDLRKSNRAAAIDAAGMFFVGIEPIAGVTMAGFKMLGALNNRRNTRRIERIMTFTKQRRSSR